MRRFPFVVFFCFSLLVCSPFDFAYLVCLGSPQDLFSALCLGPLLTWGLRSRSPQQRGDAVSQASSESGVVPRALQLSNLRIFHLGGSRPLLCPPGFQSVDVMTPFLSLVYLGTGRCHRMDRFSRLLRVGLATLPGACSRCCPEGGAPYSPADTLEHLY